MLEKLRKERGDEGFTLIELLVVIIIIGILAAIAIPVFLNQRQKGWEAAVQSDLRNAATAQETYLTEGQPGTYISDTASAAASTTSAALLEASGFKFSSPANYKTSPASMAVYAVGGNAYCMVAQAQSDRYFWYDSVTGPGKGDAAPTTTGAGTTADPSSSLCTGTDNRIVSSRSVPVTVNDPSLTPPDGRYQPEYGFGKVWRENAFVREYLGWATDWGTDYTAVWQDGYEWGHTVPLLITLPDDGYIRGDVGYSAPLTIYNFELNP